MCEDITAALQVACSDLLGRSVEQLELTLLYDSTNCGPSPQHFHASCDHVCTPTLTLLVNDTRTYAVGGYTTLPWSSNKHAFIPDPHSFLFHLSGSPRGYDSFLHPPADHTASIYCGSTYGPVFGRGHDLNAFGNGGTIAPLSVQSSYDIPDDFLGAHKFESVQVFSVYTKPAAAQSALQQSNLQQAQWSDNSPSSGRNFMPGEGNVDLIDLTQDTDDIVQPIAGHTQPAGWWRVICLTALLTLTAAAVVRCTGPAAASSSIPQQLKQIASGLQSAISTTFMQPGVVSMYSQAPEPLQGTYVQDAQPTRKQKYCMLAATISLVASTLCVLLMRCMRAQSPLVVDRLKAWGDSSQAQYQSQMQAIRAPSMVQEVASPPAALSSANPGAHEAQTAMLSRPSHTATLQMHPLMQHMRQAQKDAMPATIIAQDTHANTGDGLSDSDWEAM